MGRVNYYSIITSVKSTKNGLVKAGEYYINRLIGYCSEYRYRLRTYSNRDGTGTGTGGDIILVSPAFFQNLIDSTGFFKSALFPNRERPFILKSSDLTKRTQEELLEIEEDLKNKTFNNFNNLFGDVLDRLIIDYLGYGYVGLKLEIDEKKDFCFTALPAEEIFYYLGDKSFPVLLVHEEHISEVEAMERYGAVIQKKETNEGDLYSQTTLEHLYIHKSSKYFTGDGHKDTEYEYHLYSNGSIVNDVKGKPIIIYYKYRPIYVANMFLSSDRDYGHGDGVRALPYTFLLNKYLLKLDLNSDIQIQPPWLINNILEVQNTILKLGPRGVTYIKTLGGSRADVTSLAGAHDPKPTIQQATEYEQRIKEIFSISDYEKIISAKGQRVVLEVDTALRAAVIKFSTKAQGLRALLRGVFKACIDSMVKSAEDISVEINSKEKELSIDTQKRALAEATQYAVGVMPQSINGLKAVQENMRLYGFSHLLHSEEEVAEIIEAQQQQQLMQQQLEEQR